VSVDLRFSVLGPVRAWVRGTEIMMGQPRQKAVLASLLLRDGVSVSITELVDDLWGEDPPASAVGSIRTYVYRLRRQLDLSDLCRLRSVNAGYVLEVDRTSLDLHLFKQLVLQGRAARGAGDPGAAAGHHAEALTLWAGPALAGVPGPYAEAQRTVLGEIRLGSVEERLACDIERGMYAESAAELIALAGEYPLRERFTELMMTALYGAGRQSDALMAFRSTSRLLRESLGVSPSPALQRVHQLILTNELPLAPPPSRPAIQAGQVPQGVDARIATPAQLPAAIPNLVGREQELRRLTGIARTQSESPAMAVCVISGLFGVGKTALAVHMARRVARHYPDGQLFADLQGFGPTGKVREAGHVLAEFIEAMGVPISALPSGTRARAMLFRGLLANRRVLVVLDNVDDAEQVRPLLPGGDRCLVIVTSRRQLPGLIATNGAVPFPLRPLDRWEARELLAHRLNRRGGADEDTAVDEIIDFCGMLPLSLSVVAARAAYRADYPLAVIAAELRGSSRLDALSDAERLAAYLRFLAHRRSEVGRQALDAQQRHLGRIGALGEAIPIAGRRQERRRRMGSRVAFPGSAP